MVKILLTSVFCACMAWPALAQIDNERMQRDLEISKNILATLLKEEGKSMFGNNSIKADYVDSYGVILTIPDQTMFFNFRSDTNPGGFTFNTGGHTAQSINGDEDARRIIIQSDNENGSESQHKQEEDLESKDRDKSKEKEKDKNKDVDIRRYAYTTTQTGNVFFESTQDSAMMEKVITTFLADYADLIGQLKPEDKITVKTGSGREGPVSVWGLQAGTKKRETKTDGGYLTISATKKDVSAYKSGKIDRETFLKNLDIKRNEPNSRSADLEVFAGVFRQLFSPEYSKTFFTNDKPDYELLNDVGVIFHATTFSSYQENDLFYLPALGAGRVDEKERKEKVEEFYPRFLVDLKSFIVDYGRTIKSLDSNEKLTMKIKMTRCEPCSIPGYVEATVKVSALMDYDQQKISREKAISSIELKEIK